MVALRRPLAAGALAGAVAGATVCALQALLRLALDLPSAAELIGDRVAERIPVRPFLDVLDALGGYNRVKALSVAATIAGTLALGAAGGVLYARKAGREEQARASGRIELPGSAVVRLLVAVTLGWVVWPRHCGPCSGLTPAVSRQRRLAPPTSPPWVWRRRHTSSCSWRANG